MSSVPWNSGACWRVWGSPPALPSGRGVTAPSPRIELPEPSLARRATLVVVLLLLPSLAAAQAAGDSATVPVIHRIELIRQEIFDSSEATTWPERLSNSLHIRTRAPVIERELLFRVGEPYDSVQVAESTRNLRSLGIFRDVRIDSIQTDSGLVMRVTTRDGWTTRPSGRLRSVGGQVAIGVSFYEDNFLGRATRAGVSFSSDPVRTTFALEFRQPRLIGHRIGVGARWENRSDGDIAFGRIDRPFYSISDPWGFSASVEYRDETVSQFLYGVDVPVDTLDHVLAAARTAVTWAVRRRAHGYVRAGVLAQVVRNDYAPVADTAPIPRTVTAAVGGYIERSHSRFATRTGFQTFSRNEDVDLSTTVTAGLWAAPQFLGYDSAGIGLFATFRTGASFSNGFILVNGISSGLITAAGVDSGGTVLSSTIAWNPDANSLVVVNGSVGWLTDPAPGYEFDLGLNSGPRAFGVHSFTGNRAFFATAEVRRLLWPHVFGLVGVGFAGYVDYGGAWWSGSPTRTGTDVGIGLRIGQLRSPQAVVSRIDLSWRFANDALGAGWIVSIGRGFVFSTNAQRPGR